MLEYLPHAQPLSLCELYPDLLRQYYGVLRLDLLRASIAHRYTYAANKGQFIFAKDKCLTYVRTSGLEEHPLPFTPVAIGLSENYIVYLLDEWGGLWSYTGQTLTFVSDNILSVSPDASAVLACEGFSLLLSTSPNIIRSSVGFVGTRNYGNVPSFCDVKGQWYLGEQLVPFARAEGQCLHPNKTIHYLREGTLCWLNESPSHVFELLPSVRRMVGANGSVVAEANDGTLHFFMATAKIG